MKGHDRMVNEIRVYLPSEFTSFNDEIAEMLNDFFGGSTQLEGVGLWNGKKGIERESVTITYTYTSKINKNQIERITKFLAYIRKECEQEAILLKVNQSVYFIESDSDINIINNDILKKLKGMIING